MDMNAVACKANLKKGNEEYESSWNRCSRKEKIGIAALKDDKGMMLDEFFFGNDGDGMHDLLSRIQSRGNCSTKEQYWNLQETCG
jgi:hypothetical protein